MIRIEIECISNLPNKSFAIRFLISSPKTFLMKRNDILCIGVCVQLKKREESKGARESIRLSRLNASTELEKQCWKAGGLGVRKLKIK